ncbi:MAG TPA: hypothetical protein DF783_04965 [Acidimicrobiaceae bacterium]|nr:hypothetical protein [Acidimicrobiaceae bacterium]
MPDPLRDRFAPALRELGFWLWLDLSEERLLWSDLDLLVSASRGLWAGTGDSLQRAVASGSVHGSSKPTRRCMRRMSLSWLGWTSEITTPVLPARAVRPERWT